jgi:hypothetical protein
LGHDLLDEAAEGLDPGLGLDPVEEAGVVDVPGGEVGERAAPLVLELVQRRAVRSGGDGRVAAPERLQLGLLNGANAVANFGFERSFGRPAGGVCRDV